MLQLLVAVPCVLAGDVLPRLGGAGLPVVIEEDVKLMASEGKQGYRFGSDVALAGDTALVGAPGPNGSVRDTPGEVYIYERSEGIWSEQARLTASDASDGDFFGITVALSDDEDTALVGAASQGASRPGAVYVFTRDAGVWSEQAKLVASDGAGDDLFGFALAISGDTALVGALGAVVNGNPFQGAAYEFTRSGGVWSEQAKLTASDGTAGDLFGVSVALEGDTALVGAGFATVDGNPFQGAAYAFTRSGGVWSEQAKLTASDGTAGDIFGGPVILEGDTALIGAGAASIQGNAAQGAAYVFTHEAGVWSEQAKLTGSDGAAGDEFGAQASLDGDVALISAPRAGENRGAAYVFVHGGGIWTEQEKLIVSDDRANELVGTSVALSGTTGLLGGPTANAGDHHPDLRWQGAAYVFRLLDLAVASDPLDFGPVLVGETRGPLSVTVTNGSLDDVTVSEVSDPGAPFAAAGGSCGTPPFTLVPGESCELAFDFGPSTPGAVSATVTLSSDAPTDSLDFTLRGTGSDDALDIAPEVLDFGGYQAGTPSWAHSVTLTNADTTLLEIDSVSAPGAPFIAESGSCGEPPFTLEPFASCTLDYIFMPPEVAEYSTVVEVTSSSPGSPDNFTLQGEGILQELTIAPQTLDFGAVPVGETSAPASVTLSNTGDVGVLLLGASNPGVQFTLVEDTCGRRLLEPGASCHLDYTFAPSAAGDVSAEVAIDSDAPSNPDVVSLQGTGMGATLDIDPDSLATTLEPGQSETQTLQLVNLGNLSLEWALTEETPEVEVARSVLLPVGATTLPATESYTGSIEGLARPTGPPAARMASHPFPASGDGTTTITHSASLDIQGENSVVCNIDGMSVENQFLRTFTLPDFDILGAFDVSEVTFGIARLTTSAPITVNLYTLDGGELTYDNLSLVGTATEELAAQDLTLVTVPVTGTAPAGSTLVVEVAAPDLTGAGAAYFPGANDLGETAPSYLAATTCDLADPTPMADLGFPGVHLVMTVTGTAEAIDCALPAWAGASPLNGTVPAGESQAVDVAFDATGLEPGVFGAHLCLASNDPTRPTVAVPLTLTVGTAPALVFTPAGLDFGEVTVGTSSVPQTATLSNTGDLAAEGLAFDAPGGDFAVDASACGDTLPGGQSCEVSVTFVPAVAGPAAGTLSVSGTGGLSATLDLAGTGIEDGGLTPMALAVDPEEQVSDGNGVFEPGELVTVAPWWRNDGALPKTVMGTASDFVGPDGVPHTVETESASYGTLDPGQTGGCLDTGTCYSMVVGDPAARPAIHWDATFGEALDDDAGSGTTWTVHIGGSFTDVPPTNLFYTAIETLLHSGVTGGCVDSRYCPDGVNARSQMPVFVLRALEGADYTPEVCVEDEERFADVPFDSPFCPWIEELAARGIVSGCGDGNYCPTDAVTRAQMAIFLLKALAGAGYEPPACANRFTDVPCPSLFADWIEDLAARGITGGCTETEYCPADAVTRGQMAVFVTRTFGLAMYGP